MASARRQGTRTNNAVTKSKPDARPGSQRHAHRSRWALPLTLVAVALVGLIAWWVSSSFAGNESADSASTVQPIATLNAPDFHSLLVDPQDPEHILFGSHAGIQESRDGGFSWTAGQLRNVDAMQLAASPNSPETLYATGHDVFQVSRDGGLTWQPLANNLPGTDIHGFAQDPVDPNRLYASVVGAGSFTSADGGTTWATLPTQPPGGGALASNGTALYAATAAGIVTSSDQGVTWTPLSAQPSGQVISLAIPASDPQTLYVGTPSGLAKSTDGGTSWTTLGPEGVPVLALAVTPTDPSRILLVSDKGAIYRSNDGGTTWQSPGD